MRNLRRLSIALSILLIGVFISFSPVFRPQDRVGPVDTTAYQSQTWEMGKIRDKTADIALLMGCFFGGLVLLESRRRPHTAAPARSKTQSR